MAGENVTSPPPNPLHQGALGNSVPSASLPASSASQQQHILAMPSVSATVPGSSGGTTATPSMVSSAQISAPPGTGGVVGMGHQQFGGPQQSSQSVQQSPHQNVASVAGQSSNLPGQHMGLQNLHQQQNPTGQLHAVNLSQGQALGQNQQNLGQTSALNQMNFQQSQQQKQAMGARPQHPQYAQNQLNSGNMQAQQGISQQAASPAMVQSPPGTHTIPRTSSAQRLMQLPQGTSMSGVRASTLGSQFGQQLPGALSTMGGATSLQQQQQMLLAQRAAQGQGAVTSQQRPMQPGQVTQQNQQHSSMQSGQTGTAQALHPQLTSPAMMGSSTRPPYAAYSQHMQQQQQMGGLARPGMAGQAPGHPSMLSVQSSQQLSGLQSQFSPQQMQGRQKQGQVQASQFPTSGAAGQPMQGMQTIGMMGSLGGVGGQLVRPLGSVSQLQQRGQQAHPRPQQQQQAQQQQQQPQQHPQQPPPQQPSLTSPQKLQAQQLPRVPSVGSMGSQMSGLPPSSQSPAGPGSLPNQQQQPWMSKQMHQQPLAAAQYQMQLQQQAAQQKQVQTQHSQQPQQQPPQLQQQLQQQTQQQQSQHLPRVPPTAIQRPPTPTGGQPPSTPASGTPTTPAGTTSQPSESGNRILGKRSIQELVAQVDPNERLDPEVEDILLEIADDFIESVTTFACKLAKHRKSNILEAKDVLLHLNRNWDINIPGFGGEEYRTYKRPSISETHKQRLALIKKSIATQPTGQDTGTVKASGGPPTNASAGSQAPMAAEA